MNAMTFATKNPSPTRMLRNSTVRYSVSGVNYTQLLQLHGRGMELLGDIKFDAAAIETTPLHSTLDIGVGIIKRGSASGTSDIIDDEVIDKSVKEGKPVFLVDTPATGFGRKHRNLAVLWIMTPPWMLPYFSASAAILATNAQHNHSILLGFVGTGLLLGLATLANNFMLSRALIVGEMLESTAKKINVITSVLSPVLVALRDALAAEKIEAIGESMKMGITQPEILISFGAGHYGIRRYLERPGLRRFVIRFLKPFSHWTIDKESYSTIGIVSSVGASTHVDGKFLTGAENGSGLVCKVYRLERRKNMP